jgi:hypothetical protein
MDWGSKFTSERLASSGKRKQVYYTIIPLLVIIMHDDDSDNIVTTSGGFHMCPVCVFVFKSATPHREFYGEILHRWSSYIGA